MSRGLGIPSFIPVTEVSRLSNPKLQSYPNDPPDSSENGLSYPCLWPSG